MKILIHAVPQRRWYVENFLIPELERQGADQIRVFADHDGLGNLEACLQSFELMPEDGGTWHLQDDVLPAADFVKRAGSFVGPVANGFCCTVFNDSPYSTGQVYMPDLWHSFQCIYIRDSLAKEFAAWVRSGNWVESPNSSLQTLKKMGRGDDSFFREFLLCRHPGFPAYNFSPNLVEHVDWLIGGSTLSTGGSWQFNLPRSALWEDESLVTDLQTRIRVWKRKNTQTTP